MGEKTISLSEMERDRAFGFDSLLIVSKKKPTFEVLLVIEQNWLSKVLIEPNEDSDLE
jgi:hypothetical protein